MKKDGIPIIEQTHDELTRAERRANRRRSTRKKPSLVVKSSLEKRFRSILSKMKHQAPAECLKDDPLEDYTYLRSSTTPSDLQNPQDPTETETEEGDDENQNELTTAVLAKAAHPPRRRRRTILRKPSGKGDLLSLLQDGLNVPGSDQMDMHIDMKDYRPNFGDGDDSDSDEDGDDAVFDECQDETLRGLLRSSRAQLNTLLRAPIESQRFSLSAHKTSAVDQQLAPEEACKKDRPRHGQSLSKRKHTTGGTKPRRSPSTVANSKSLDPSSLCLDSSSSCSGSGKRLASVEGKDMDGTASKRRSSLNAPSRRRGASVKPSQDDGHRCSGRRRSSSVVPTAASTSTASKRLGRRTPMMAESRRSKSCSRRHRSGRDVAPTKHDSIKPASSSSSSESQQRNQNRSRHSAHRQTTKEDVTSKNVRSSHHERRSVSQKVVEPLQ